MNFKVVIDWKFVAAMGGAVSLAILATRIDSSAAERVLTNLVSTNMGLVSASDCGH